MFCVRLIMILLIFCTAQLRFIHFHTEDRSTNTSPSLQYVTDVEGDNLSNRLVTDLVVNHTTRIHLQKRIHVQLFIDISNCHKSASRSTVLVWEIVSQ